MFAADSHLDLAYTLDATGRDFGQVFEEHSISLPGLRQGGVGLIFATIFAAGEGESDFDGLPGQRQMEIYEDLFTRFGDDLARVTDAASLAQARKDGRIGVVLLMEGADPLTSAEDLNRYHRAGLRLLGPAWNNRNRFASGINSRQGLTDEGRHLLAIMNDLGVAADLSHLNPACFWDVMELAEVPVFASHSNARAVTDIPRNLDDRQIQAVADAGGVVGLNFYEGFLRRTGHKGRAGRDDLIAHVDHLFDRVGAGVCAIGSDFDGGFGPEKTVEGFERPERLPDLADFLAERGYSDEDVRGILGENHLAYLGRLWKTGT